MVSNSLTTKIILTSDDFGLSRICDQEILKRINNGYLSSVSVMINKIKSSSYLELKKLKKLRANNVVSIGLHLELPSNEGLNTLSEQWDKFNFYLKIPPDYIDIHKSNLHSSSLNSIAQYCNLKKVAFRSYQATNVEVNSPTESFTLTGLSSKKIVDIINSLKTANSYEFVFHIGKYDLNSKSSLNRERELDSLKLEEVYNEILKRKIEIIKYTDLA